MAWNLVAHPILVQDSPQASLATSMVSDSLPPAMQRFTFRPLRRSSSRIQRWVQDQQKRHSAGEITEGALDAAAGAAAAAFDVASGCHPWRVAPQVAVHRPSHDGEDVVMLDEAFVFVDEDGRRSVDAQVSAVTVTRLLGLIQSRRSSGSELSTSHLRHRPHRARVVKELSASAHLNRYATLPGTSPKIAESRLQPPLLYANRARAALLFFSALQPITAHPV